MHKLAKFSANPGEVHFERLIHLLRYIRDNNTLGLEYYADLNDAPVTATVKVSTKFYKTTLPADMIFTKEDVSTSDEQVEKLTREYSIHYRA